MRTGEDRIGRLEALVRRDPAGRGLISSEADRGVLCEGHLAGAVGSLAGDSGPVAILTGFFIPRGEEFGLRTLKMVLDRVSNQADPGLGHLAFDG